MNERHDNLQEIIDAALLEMAAEESDGFDPQTCNLAEFYRRTGLTRSWPNKAICGIILTAPGHRLASMPRKIIRTSLNPISNFCLTGLFTFD